MKTPGQKAYESNVAKNPTYHDGKPRKSWEKLSKIARESWEKQP